MKKQPLKNKKTYLGTGSHGNDDTVFKFKYVKSAVEWLKEQILKDGMWEITTTTGKAGLIDVKKVFNKIDKAFEDVK